MTTLYRTHRPKDFSEVIGQDHIRIPLENSLKAYQISHAYLFSGSRGTGKTTMARLLAKAANCLERGKEPNACHKCAVCKEIGDNRSIDVIEIDAASNRGIDEVRDLREKIAFAPTRSKYRVYIIDEVHMLTKEAFNALLKTLEEPPEHVIFILATTELHKVPETIVSRCQRYQFHRAPVDLIVKLIKKVVKKEKLELVDEVAELIARRAEGSYRDALSLLSSALAHGEYLDVENFRSLLGLPQTIEVEKLIEAVRAGDSASVIAIVRDFLKNGGDLSVLIKAMTENLKEAVFATEIAETQATNARLLEEMMLLLGQAKVSSDPVALLTARLMTLTYQTKPIGTAEVVKQIHNDFTPPITDIAKVIPPPPIENAPSVDAVTPVSVKPVEEGDFWVSLVEEVKNHNHALYAVVHSAELQELTDDKMVVGVQFRFYGDRLYEPKNRSLVESLASKIAGRTIKLECVVTGKQTVAVDANPNLVETVVEVFEIAE